MGTYGFMAPEVIDGVPYDYKSDIYSLGCLLHFMCTRGRRPSITKKNKIDQSYSITLEQMTN